MSTLLATRTSKLISIKLVGCNHIIWLPEETVVQYRRTHKEFNCNYCTNTNHYPGESDVEALERKLANKQDMLDTARQNTARERDRANYLKRSRATVKGHLTRTKKRVAAGVCPCCNRTFKQLARHMKSQHPHYAETN